VTSTPTFAVITAAQVTAATHGAERQLTQVLAEAYRLHGTGHTVNPSSSFLRFPDRPSSRIIALPASLRQPVGVDGIKWVASCLGNTAVGLPRASAVLILNHQDTGFPFACMEASIVSACRTAASTALAAITISRRRRVTPRRVGFIGCGLIATYIQRYLAATELRFDHVAAFDRFVPRAQDFASQSAAATGVAATVHTNAEELIRSCDLVVLATVAETPHILDPAVMAHNPLVLHISLRDLSPQIILASHNIVDDTDHCLNADTSTHLAAQTSGNRDFIAGTLFDVLEDRITPPRDKPVIFSPFGLGVLDLAVARYVYDRVAATGDLAVVPGFFDAAIPTPMPNAAASIATGGE
jgi:ornithine cyclodeaminase